mmetsp:Transcript_28517/g.33809  ORF Transcript_28517/g.33809 Transcript_28517/m.33809 type:complete len:202 (-) Transcript_28517:1657-2262(-)
MTFFRYSKFTVLSPCEVIPSASSLLPDEDDDKFPVSTFLVLNANELRQLPYVKFEDESADDPPPPFACRAPLAAPSFLYRLRRDSASSIFCLIVSIASYDSILADSASPSNAASRLISSRTVLSSACFSIAKKSGVESLAPPPPPPLLLAPSTSTSSSTSLLSSESELGLSCSSFGIISSNFRLLSCRLPIICICSKVDGF